MLDLLKLDFLKGYRTYIIAAIVAGLAGVTAFGIEIPEWVWIGLGAIGLGSLRAGVAGFKNAGK